MQQKQLIIKVWQQPAQPIEGRSETNLRLVNIDRTPRATWSKSRYYLAGPASVRRLTTWAAAHAQQSIHTNDERTPLGVATTYWFRLDLSARLREWYHDHALLSQIYPPHVAGWQCTQRNPESVLLEAGRHMRRMATVGDIFRLAAMRERSKPQDYRPCTHLEQLHLGIFCVAWEHRHMRVIDL